MDAVNSKKPPKPVKCCEFCGKPPGHLRQKCPAKDATCHKHSKRGHWGFICKSSKTVGLVEEEDYAFLGAIGTETGENTLVGKAHLKQLPCLLQNRQRCGCDCNSQEYLQFTMSIPNSGKIKQDFVWSSRYSSSYSWLLYEQN